MKRVIKIGGSLLKSSSLAERLSLCQENNVPIIVFDMNKPGNLERLVMGEEQVGTLIS